MKPILVSYFAAISQAVASSVTNLWLNPLDVVEVSVAQNWVTTISFPQNIQSLDGVGLTTDNKPTGLFQLAQSETSLAIRALKPGATANLNVRLGNQTYVLVLTEAKTPVLAMNFRSPLPLTKVNGEPIKTTDLQLLGLLERARNYLTLKKQHPSLVSDVTRDEPRSVSDFENFTVRLEEVLRFDQADALAFRVSLRSKTGQEIRIRSGSWAVRVGERLYPQALAEALEVIPADGEVTVWFLIQGSPDGRLNRLSPHNLFIVLVNPQ